MRLHYLLHCRVINSLKSINKKFLMPLNFCRHSEVILLAKMQNVGMVCLNSGTAKDRECCYWCCAQLKAGHLVLLWCWEAVVVWPAPVHLPSPAHVCHQHRRSRHWTLRNQTPVRNKRSSSESRTTTTLGSYHTYKHKRKKHTFWHWNCDLNTLETLTAIQVPSLNSK